MFRFLYFLILGTVAAKYEYDGETPIIDVKFATDAAAAVSKVQLTLDRREYFVLSNKCAAKDSCTKSAHTNVYDPTKYNGGSIDTRVSVNFQQSTLTGEAYEGLAIYGNVNENQQIRAIEGVTGSPADLEEDGVFGLTFTSKPTTVSPIYKILNKAPTGKRMVIFRRGPFKQQKKTQEIKAAKGAFEIGEETLEGCGEFVFRDTIDNEGWTIEASVKIGAETITNQKIAFSFDKLFTVPTAQFDKFKDKTDATLPEVSIEFDGKEFELKKENLQDYRDDKHEVLTLLVQSEDRTGFLLGKNFLKDYCIALKATDDALTKFQVGLAPIVALEIDPQWEDYTDDRDGNNGNGVRRTYEGETPIIDLQYANTGTSIPVSKGLLTLEETFTFVLATPCQAKDSCTTFAHNNVFDTSTGTDRGTAVSIPYKGSTLTGSTYQGLLVVGNINGNEDFGAITGVTGSKVDLEQDAVFGLSFGDTLPTGFAINKFLNNAPNGKKTIVFRRGPFRQQLKTQEFKSPSGSFVIGQNTLEGCGAFSYQDTIDKAGWSIKAKVNIDGVSLNDQTISFSFDKLFTVPTAQFDKFKDKTDATLPEVSIEFDGKEFELKKENLQDYRDDKHEVLTLLVQSEDRTGFLLGKNFLKDYCIALKATDDLTKFQVGLAPIIRQRSDPQWELYPAPDDSLKYSYNGESPTIDVKFTESGDTSIPISKALLTLDETFSIFLSEGCKVKDSCTTFEHRNVYDPTTYNGEDTGSDVSEVFRGVTFKGSAFLGTLVFGNVKGKKFIKAVSSIEGGDPVDLWQDAVLGLNFKTELSTGYAINQILSNAPAGKKSVIFRRGPFAQSLKTQEFTRPRGSFVIGADQLLGCGEFTYQDTISQDGWNIKATVYIGGVPLEDQTISFSFDKHFTVPTAQFDKFKDKTDATLPEVSIEFKNKKFELKKENLQDYRDARHEVLTLLVQSEDRTGFLLGKNFLKDYCIALKATDDLTKFQVGLAPFVPLESDSKWSLYDAGKSSKHEYSGETPLLDLKFEKDATSTSKAILTLAESNTFVLETGCAPKDKCTKYQHDNVYDPTKYSGIDVNVPVELTYKGSTLKGKTYQTAFITGNHEASLAVSTVSEVTGDPVDLSADGVIGLAFTETPTFGIATFFGKAPIDKKTIIVRRGPFVQKLKDQEIKEAKGTLVIGDDTLAGCGSFAFKKTIDKEGWTIKADVKIGEKPALKDQTIAFSFDQLFTVPEAQFAEFKDKPESELPDVSIEFSGDDKFLLTKKNLQHFADDNHEKLSLLVQGEKRTSFLLGRNFLSDFCIALSANNDLNDFQIGLAPITTLDSDSKWIKYDDGPDKGNGTDTDSGDGKGKDKGKSAFTASSSLALQLFFAFAIAFIARLAQ